MTELIVLASLAGIAIGKIPALRMNRATIAVCGATLLILTKSITIDEAYQAVDLNTIVLLFSMMVFNANLRYAGFFTLAGHLLKKRAHNPALLLLLIILFSSFLSALFINDPLVMMLTPIVCDVTLSMGLNPLPYLLGIAVSANIGSMTTIIGNPQNILIGASSGMSFGTFSLYLIPPAILILGIAYVLILVLFRKDFTAHNQPSYRSERIFIYKPLLIKSGIAFVIMALCVILGLPVSIAGLAGSAFLLITRRISPERVFADVDWSLLVLFPSLFVITRAAAGSSVFTFFYEHMSSVMQKNPAGFGIIAAVMSQIISNVPTVMLLRTIVPSMPNPTQLWLILAGCTTLAGNFTLLGSVANLIMAELAKKRGVTVTFGNYLKLGLPLTIVSIIILLLWLIGIAPVI